MHTQSIWVRRRLKHSYVVKHGYRTSMYSTEVPQRLVSRTEFCCPEAFTALRAADRLRWPWSWLWKRWRKKLRKQMFEDPKVLKKPLICVSDEKRSSSA